jgi:hypothetical protein
MKTIAKPKKEKTILASVSREVSKKQIVREIQTKAESCVNHLCGCKK